MLSQYYNHETIGTLILFLSEASLKQNCIVPVYCFMPDHLHFMLAGQQEQSDLKKAVINFKQKSGYWFSQNAKEVQLQKGFYDHLHWKDHSITNHIRYILENPVRKEIVSEWNQYPYSGSIGVDLFDVLGGKPINKT
ncbi:MAG: transposase [bacterium]|nr:transposase [bacterium]